MDMLDEGYIAGHVLDSTPPVISVGRLTMDHGYTFIWPPHENPYFIPPGGDDTQRILLRVEDYIPYFITTDDDSRGDCRRIPSAVVQTASPAPPITDVPEPHSDITDPLVGEDSQWSQADELPEEFKDHIPLTPTFREVADAFVGPRPTSNKTHYDVTNLSETDLEILSNHSLTQNMNTSTFPLSDDSRFRRDLSLPNPPDQAEVETPPAQHDTPNGETEQPTQNEHSNPAIFLRNVRVVTVMGSNFGFAW